MFCVVLRKCIIKIKITLDLRHIYIFAACPVCNVDQVCVIHGAEATCECPENTAWMWNQCMPIAGKSWYIVKLVFTGVYIFLIFALKQGLWVLVRTTSLRRF